MYLDTEWFLYYESRKEAITDRYRLLQKLPLCYNASYDIQKNEETNQHRLLVKVPGEITDSDFDDLTQIIQDIGQQHYDGWCAKAES
jgi:hypothetical protein